MRRILSKCVSEVMTKKVISIDPGASLFQVRKLFEKHDFNAFPVTDSENRLLGLVSKTDFLKVFTCGLTISLSKVNNLWARTASDIMTVSPRVVQQSSKILDAANIMVEYNYRSVPVADKSGKVVGILTSSDITKYTLLEVESKA